MFYMCMDLIYMKFGRDWKYQIEIIEILRGYFKEVGGNLF